MRKDGLIRRIAQPPKPTSISRLSGGPLLSLIATVSQSLQGEVILNAMISCYICLLTCLHIPPAFANTQPTEQPTYTNSQQTRMYIFIAASSPLLSRAVASSVSGLTTLGASGPLQWDIQFLPSPAYTPCVAGAPLPGWEN